MTDGQVEPTPGTTTPEATSDSGQATTPTATPIDLSFLKAEDRGMVEALPPETQQVVRDKFYESHRAAQQAQQQATEAQRALEASKAFAELGQIGTQHPELAAALIRVQRGEDPFPNAQPNQQPEPVKPILDYEDPDAELARRMAEVEKRTEERILGEIDKRFSSMGLEDIARRDHAMNHMANVWDSYPADQRPDRGVMQEAINSLRASRDVAGMQDQEREDLLRAHVQIAQLKLAAKTKTPVPVPVTTPSATGAGATTVGSNNGQFSWEKENRSPTTREAYNEPIGGTASGAEMKALWKAFKGE